MFRVYPVWWVTGKQQQGYLGAEIWAHTAQEAMSKAHASFELIGEITCEPTGRSAEHWDGVW